MARWEDIHDWDSLEAWLRGRPREVSVAIAVRAALRVILLWAEFCENERKRDLTPVPVFRLSLISSVAAVTLSDEIRFAVEAAIRGAFKFDSATRTEIYADANAHAFHAGDAISFAAQLLRAVDNADTGPDDVFSHTASAAKAAADATGAYFATTADSDTASKASNGKVVAAAWDVVRFDAQAVEDGAPIPAGPLWHVANPLQNLWEKTRVRWSLPGSPFDFWRRWYESLLAGTPMNPDLLYQIALIPNEIWDAGPEAVADAIREIEAEFEPDRSAKLPENRVEEAIAITPYGERIEINPDTGKLRAVPDSDLPGDISDYAARKISSGIGLFDDDPRNQYTALAPELDLLRQALQVEPRLPVELFDVCASVSNRVRIRVETGDLPEPEKDPILADFLARIRDAAADIFAHDAKTRNMVEARNAVLGDDALVEDRDQVIAGAALLERIAEGALLEDLPKDAETATDENAAPEERKAASFRLSSRVVRIAKWIGWAVAGTGGAVVGAKEVLEAIPAIRASPIYQQLLEIVLRSLGL